MKQEQILKAAKELFTKYGFKKVSMDEIASETGVTKKQSIVTLVAKRNF